MSKISLKSSSSGTATFTIESPATNTDRTLVLPDVAGTVALTSQIPAAYTDTDALDLFNASGSAPVFACRAFVNFNGIGTVAIRASGNVSSITDNGTGDFTVNFTTAMPDLNYAVGGTLSADVINQFASDSIKPFSYATTSVRIGTCFSSGAVGQSGLIDRVFNNVLIFR